MRTGLDVLGVGVSTIDLIVRVPAFPEVDGRMDMRDFTQAIGGNATVAAVALARLGARVGVAGNVGDDTFGRAVRDGLDEDGVDTSLLVADANRQTITTVIISDLGTGTRSIINHPAIAGITVTSSDEMARAAEAATYLHLDHAALPALAGTVVPQARAAGTLISFDAGVDVPNIERYLRLIDIYVATRRQLLAMTGELDLGRALAWVRAAGPRIVAATLGVDGSVGLGDDGGLVTVPAFPVEVADSTGAGDVFHGAFLYGLLRGWTMQEMLTFANATAALSCRAVGGRPGCPRLDEVYALLRTREATRPVPWG